MKNSNLGFFTISGAMAAVLTALIVAVFAFAQGGLLFSPGSLNARGGSTLGGVNSHAEIAGRCNLCHAPFWSTSTMADRCVVCHSDVEVQLLVPSPLHGLLHKNYPNLTCWDCHPDHRGPGSPLTDISNIGFPHNSFGFLLTAHQSKTDGSPFDCKDCHAKDYSRYDQNICVTCHVQIDKNFMQSHSLNFGGDCLACHDGVDTYGHNFDHNSAAFPLTGKHAQVQCLQCHINARTLKNLKSTPQTCLFCHLIKDVHLGRLGPDCGSCHTTAGWTPASFDHNLAAFKLTGKHIDVSCADCHIDHVLQGTPTACVSCHAAKDVHKNRLGTQCGSCHTTDAWTPATFDHNLAAFKLTGKHITTPCQDCHINHVLQGTLTACYSCHAVNDAHHGQLGTDCGLCHSTSAWLPATINHNLFSFKLTGAHTNAPCVSCHANNIFKGAPTDCYSCHASQDNHGGQFGRDCGTCHSTSAWKPATFDHSRSGFPLTGAHASLNCSQCHSGGGFGGLSTACVSCHAEPSGHFGTDCAQCHSTSNWNATFNHPNACGDGGCLNHHGATCADCHPGGNYSSHDCRKCHDSNNPGD